MTERINIGTNNISTISISGPESQTEKMIVVLTKAKILLQQYGGSILREKSFKDGFFLEVWFASEQMKQIWNNSIKDLIKE